MISQLEYMIKYGLPNRDNIPLTRRDVINALMATVKDSRLRFQGINLANADLSRLDLRYINLKVQIFDIIMACDRQNFAFNSFCDQLSLRIYTVVE